MQCETVSGGLHGNALIVATAKKMIAQVKQLMDSGQKPFKWCHNALGLWNDDVENSFR